MSETNQYTEWGRQYEKNAIEIYRNHLANNLIEIKCRMRCFIEHPHFDQIMQFDAYMRQKDIDEHAYTNLIKHPYAPLPDSAFQSIKGLIEASCDLGKRYSAKN